jgi:hypothetical protein
MQTSRLPYSRRSGQLFSKGAYFNREIRDHYAYREVTREHSG